MSARPRSDLGALALAVACTTGCLGSFDEGPERPGAATLCDPSGADGAPVPMRRLTREQVERTVRDVLGLPLDETLAVPDERLFSYRSNISSAVDVTMARAYLDYAEASAARADVSRCAGAPCLPWLLDDVGRRFFRRSLGADERARYTTLYEAGASALGPEAGARWVLEAMMQSPSFLYLDEGTEPDGRLDDFAVATRLSLTLWGSAPDATLLDVAERGALSSPAQVRTAAERLLEDPRSAGGLTDFVDQWLALSRLDSATARPDVAALGEETVAALRAEPALFFRALTVGSGGLEELLTATETPEQPALASLYGADVVGSHAGPDGRVSELDPTRRSGILTLPGVQTALAHAGATSPTLRGFEVLSGFLCTPPGAPPAGVSVTLPPPVPGSTTRERLERHFSDASCASCHRSMDGIGFSFESYDWLGRSRDMEAGRPIDDAGSFELSGRTVSVDGPVDLGDELAGTQQVARCIAQQWTQFATGVPTTADSACLVETMARTLRSERGGLREMILAQVTSDGFLRGGVVR